jgi:hypothetical protein
MDQLFASAAMIMMVVSVLVACGESTKQAQSVAISQGLPVITPTVAVVHAGGHELRQFRIGALVASESGCLACHRMVCRAMWVLGRH